MEATISNILDQKDATVYGVEVSDNDGKAGMVAIPAMDGDEDVDLDKLVMGVMKELPAYARPIFVRMVKKRLDLTGEFLETFLILLNSSSSEFWFLGTYKLKKNDLQNEGFDLSKITDPIYFLNAKLGKYVKLDGELYRDIMAGKQKV